LIRKREVLTPSFKVWLGKGKMHVLGEGGASLLDAVDRYGSITEAAKKTGISYKYAWDRLADIQTAIGRPILRTRRGGRIGGGGAELTETARTLLRNYQKLKEEIRRVVEDSELWLSI
jgi:molybdate transport system regulatory protein